MCSRYGAPRGGVLTNGYPYGCDADQGRAILDRAGGTLVVRDDGHFGDVDQPYATFPLLDRLIL